MFKGGLRPFLTPLMTDATADAPLSLKATPLRLCKNVFFSCSRLCCFEGQRSICSWSCISLGKPPGLCTVRTRHRSRFIKLLLSMSCGYNVTSSVWTCQLHGDIMDITTALLDHFFLLRNQRQQQGVRLAGRAEGMRLDICLSGI